ncbi:response regulator transcription factor [Kineosporia sp. A_224]|uniref:response regulator transcription factor n=1 Tax=Kineosporia sp. A_224 TaxID=1962180 RepID=UPI000B4B9A0B|nr:response regulator transcription factor [Kineosporia sp. A_224]
MAAPLTVLVVEDDETVADVVAAYLQDAGLTVVRAADGVTALAVAARERPDLVVLDLMLPGIDGLEVCRRLREARADLPVVMLTALGDEADRLAGLESGADDYVVKPFSPRELVLRVQAVLRRAAPSGGGGTPGPAAALAAAGRRRLVAGGLVVDLAARTVTRDGAPLTLTARELDLLAHLMAHPGTAFSREQLMREVWGWDFGDTSTVTVHVRRLREKIEADPSAPALLATVWGVGYRWEQA